MAKKKKLNMDKMKSTLKRNVEHHANWKETIRNAVDAGEHRTADTAIKLLHKSKAAIHKLIEHVEGHSTKAKAKAALKNLR